MYDILFYENGAFCTQIGGSVGTLPEAIAQIETLAKGLQAKELDGLFGYGFDRNGTPCAFIVADRFGFPIKND